MLPVNFGYMVGYLFTTTALLGYVVSVIIQSSPQLGVDTVCDNQDVTLFCQTDQAGSTVTWHWSNQSQHGDTITVVARMIGVVYTCKAFVPVPHAVELWTLNINVVANGAPPQLDRYNFSPYISKYEGSNLTLVTKIISDLPLSSGDVLKWVRLHQPFPLTAVVDNYTIYEVLYSRLSLYELSFEDDSGNYTNIVSNQCGTTSVSVYIDVRKAPICNNSGSVVVPQKNIMTVKGESITLHCLFKGNLEILSPTMSSYWMIGPHGQYTESTNITDNSTDPYRIAVYQTCLSEDGSCCNFTNQLNIIKVPLELHNVNLTCGEVLNEVSREHTALMMVFNVPTVAKTSAHNTKSSKILQCQFNASTMKDITFVVWMKGDVAINSSDHYKIRTFTKPTIDDLIISELTINNIIASDQGKYSCYCYYNQELVMAKNPVISEQQSFSVYFKKRKKFTVEYIAVAIVVSLLLMLSVLVILYYKRLCHLHNKVPAEKEKLVCSEENTGGTGYYGMNKGFVKEEVGDLNRRVGAASADRSNNGGQMITRSVANHNSPSVNPYTTGITPNSANQDSHPEEHYDKTLTEMD